MPYICTDQNRYIGEHDCGRYHFGDMTMIRECCVADARAHAALALRVAMTEHHPAMRMYRAAFNSLTDAEQQLVPDFYLDYNSDVHYRTDVR